MKKVILLTGATDGIGLVTVEKLVNLGHSVLIHGRSAEKLKAAEDKLTNLNSGTVKSYRADLSNFKELEAFAHAVLESHEHIDVIINNAGIYKTQTPITQDKLDVRFVVNTIAPYFLTKRLLPLLDKNSRVINLSSAAQSPVDLSAMAGKHFIDDPFTAYAQSKLAIAMWSHYLANKLADDGPAVIAVNPGSLLASKMVKEGFGVAGKDINIGADILIRASLSDDFSRASGLYFDNDVGDFSPSHADALDLKKCEALVVAIEKILIELGVVNLK